MSEETDEQQWERTSARYRSISIAGFISSFCLTTTVHIYGRNDISGLVEERARSSSCDRTRSCSCAAPASSAMVSLRTMRFRGFEVVDLARSPSIFRWTALPLGLGDGFSSGMYRQPRCDKRYECNTTSPFAMPDQTGRFFPWLGSLWVSA